MAEKILIADDEPSNRKILGRELAHRGFVVDTAVGGKEALLKMDSSPPDLSILDYMMPDLSGVEVLKQLRKKRQRHPGHHYNGIWFYRARGRGDESRCLRFYYPTF